MDNNLFTDIFHAIIKVKSIIYFLSLEIKIKWDMCPNKFNFLYICVYRMMANIHSTMMSTELTLCNKKLSSYEPILTRFVFADTLICRGLSISFFVVAEGLRIKLPNNLRKVRKQ